MILGLICLQFGALPLYREDNLLLFFLFIFNFVISNYIIIFSVLDIKNSERFKFEVYKGEKARCEALESWEKELPVFKIRKKYQKNYYTRNNLLLSVLILFVFLVGFAVFLYIQI